MRPIIVNIDSLVLKGFRHEDRHAIAAAVQDEIVRALAAPDAAAQLPQLGSIPNLRIGNVDVAVNAKPQHVGAAAGHAIGRRLIK